MHIKKYTKEAGKAVQLFATGQGVSSKFFKRNFFATCLILLFCVGFIALRFDCITSMERIKSMKTQIENMRTYKQRERSTYMTLTRESAMQHTVDSLGLGLTIPEKYPLSITYGD